MPLARQPKMHLAVFPIGMPDHELGAQSSRIEPFGIRLAGVVKMAEHPDLPAVHPHVLVGRPGMAVSLQQTVVAAQFTVERMLHPPRYHVVEQRRSILITQRRGPFRWDLLAG